MDEWSQTPKGIGFTVLTTNPCSHEMTKILLEGQVLCQDRRFALTFYKDNAQVLFTCT